MTSVTDGGKSSVNDINQKLKSGSPASYPFVDLIRFISMMGIVWAHVDMFSTKNHTFNSLLLSNTYELSFIFYKQVFKFSVLCFFMISGFLLSDRLQAVNSYSYIKRRFDTTFKPYVLALIIFLGLLMIRKYVFHHSVTPDNTNLSIIKFCFFDTLFWYLPNYFICLAILLVFKKYISSIFLGIGLLGITLVYTALNVYTVAYAAPHATALLGYVFYLWLGAFIKEQNIVEKIWRVKPIILFAVAFVLYICSTAEAYWLYIEKYSFQQYFHILRIFNQLYSVAVFVFLIGVCRSKINFGFFNPRKETFGIYLYHGFFIYFFVPKALEMIKRYLNVEIYSYDTTIRLLIITFYWALCYFGTTLLVKVLQKFKLMYL
ncbi:acyltransferase family protein [Mucilaginibacter lacusdianchii]|uniref:acyltransferase family protein n=1 Tax=Mucilaginibacter lacusdianchii TaxID=2684211 RepID=UPI00131C2982|nr:acyltransferase [Mucilaginibacter sp. JXJ CY 39]